MCSCWKTERKIAAEVAVVEAGKVAHGSEAQTTATAGLSGAGTASSSWNAWDHHTRKAHSRCYWRMTVEATAE